jgi:hypothetical protein
MAALSFFVGVEHGQSISFSSAALNYQAIPLKTLRTMVGAFVRPRAWYISLDAQ